MRARVMSWLAALARRRRVEQEMDDEWRFHLECRIDALVAEGIDRREAERQAAREFGSAMKWHEDSRDVRGLDMFDALHRDCTYAFRQIRRAPGFTALVVLTLAIGIGATTAMFSVVDAMLLRPLRFPGAERASEVWTQRAEGANAQPGAAILAFSVLRDGLADVATVEGYRFGAGTIVGGAEPRLVPMPEVTPGLLHMVGAVPLIGRLFNEDDAVPESRTVLISERLWTSEFGRDPAVIERRVAIDGDPYTVVGVLPGHLRYPEARVDVWKPLDIASASQGRGRIQNVVVRRPGVSLDELRARLSAMVLSLREAGTLAAGESLLLDDVVQVRVSRSWAQPLWMLSGAVGLVLLIACVNVMNLLLVRASNRRGELAVQSALGADRFTLVRQAVTEVMMLAVVGTMAGLGLAAVLLRAVPAIVPPQMGYMSAEPGLNWYAVAFASAMAMMVSLLAGFVPAWRSSRVDMLDAMKGQTRTIAGSRDERWQGALLAVQIGTVLMLLGGTSLLLRSFVKLTNVDPGYDAAALVSVSVQPTSPRHSQPGATFTIMQDLQRQVQDTGVGLAAFTAGTSFTFDTQPEGEGGLPVDATGMRFPWNPVSPDYFETMGIPVLEGRSFTPDDGPEAIVVNDRLAHTFWGEQSPIGHRFRMNVDQPWRTVVGVVGDVRMMGLDDPTGHGMEFYTPLQKDGTGATYYMLMVRSALSPEMVVSRVKELLWAIDPDVPVVEAGSFREVLIEGHYRRRFVLRLTAAFGAIAVLLTGVGIYGVAAYWVARRRHDLAVRVAFGAQGRHLVGLMLGRAAIVCAAGAALGVAGFMGSSRVLESWLYDTRPTDPLALGTAALLVIVLVATACLAPARAAVAVDPLTILREE